MITCYHVYFILLYKVHMITCYHVSEDCTSIRMVSGDHYVQDAAMTASSKMSDSTDASRARIVSNIGKYRALVGRLFPQPKIVAHNTYEYQSTASGTSSACFLSINSIYFKGKIDIRNTSETVLRSQYSPGPKPRAQELGSVQWPRCVFLLPEYNNFLEHSFFHSIL